MSARVHIDERGPSEGLPEGFLELAQAIYKDDPHWIPESRATLERTFSREHPFLKKGTFRLFSLPGKVRAAAFYAPQHFLDAPRGASFAYWESTGELEAERLVYERIAEWAKDLGADNLVGPLAFDLLGQVRWHVEGERNWKPYQGEPYHPAFYPAHAALLGFTQGKRSITHDIDIPLSLAEELVARGAHLKAQGYRVEPLTPDVLEERAEELHALNEEAWTENYRYSRFTFEEFRTRYLAALARTLCPRSSSIAYGPKGDIACTWLLLPNWSPLLCQGAGDRRVLSSEIDYTRHFAELPTPRTLIMKNCIVAKAHRGAELMWWVIAHGVARSYGDYATFVATTMQNPAVFKRVTTEKSRGSVWSAFYERTL